MRAAVQLDYDTEDTELSATVAVEKYIDSNSVLKAKLKHTGDADVALTTSLSPGVDLTLCFGMELAEWSMNNLKKQH